MQNAFRNTSLAGVLVLIWISSAMAQQVRFPDFSSVAFLQLNGAQQAQFNGQYVLRLTPGGTATRAGSATTWFTIPQLVNSGFTTYFRFQIHNAPSCCNPGDGLAFVIQNSSSTDKTYGTNGKGGLNAVGVGNGGIGYAGIPNSLAIEFDTLESFDIEGKTWDPTIDGNNHVAVQGCGPLTNGPVHVAGTFTIGQNNHVTSCLVNSGLNNCPGPNNCGNLPPLPHLGVTCNGETCADGRPHDVVIEYAQVGCPKDCVWTLNVYVDPRFITNTHTPVPGTTPTISIPYNIIYSIHNLTGLNLANNTSAWLGFAASQTTQPQQQDILAWEFTPHAPIQVQQPIPNGGTKATYNFGANDTDVTYFPSFVNQNGCDGKQPGVTCLMTVLATPTPRKDFFQKRLKGTNFANEQCVVYQGTGGNCVVYSITCQNSSDPKTNVDCPSDTTGTCVDGGNQSTCIQFTTSYYTADGVTPSNADYLKADPIGSNNWFSIFTKFESNIFDPRTSGSGGTPSDFVATFRVGAQP